MVKKILAACFLAQTLLFAQSYSFCNDNMSEEDKVVLASGENIMRTIPYKKISIESSNPAFVRAKKAVSELKPPYFAEVIQVYPVDGNEDFISKFSSLIMDIPSYVGIPYYSERAEKWYDLYSDAKILSQEVDGSSKKLLVDLVMEPFDLIKTEIVTDEADDYFYYESTNLSTLRYYDKFDCVKPRHQKSIVILFREGDNWILYGAAAIKAPDLFFVRDRIETSFLNRIKTFVSAFCKKL